MGGCGASIHVPKWERGRGVPGTHVCPSLERQAPYLGLRDTAVCSMQPKEVGQGIKDLRGAHRRAGGEDVNLPLLTAQRVSFQRGCNSHCVLGIGLFSPYELSCSVTATVFSLKSAKPSNICMSADCGASPQC